MHTIPLRRSIIYGPVSSRRLGQSLGLNISPLSYKFCSFNCVYCQYGWTAIHSLDTTGRLEDFPTPKAFSKALETALQEATIIDNITFSGNGEPTLHPQFEELVDIAEELKEKYRPQTRIGILSNASTVSDDNVSRALAKLDFRVMKLDAGDLGTFGRINRPCQGVSYDNIVHSLKSLGDITLQTMFVAGEIQNIDHQEIENWIQRVGEIHPLKSQIYSLHRPPACPSLQGVGRERLQKIASQTQQITGVPVEVIVASSDYRTIY
jgi:wyosine [tRNA(Phe)-imidazoG37] synthetase (radical SAM superfamily)